MFGTYTLLGNVNIWDSLVKLFSQSGFSGNPNDIFLQIIMLIISFVLMFLAIVKKFEPLLLLPIAFGMFIANIPGAGQLLLAEPVKDEITHEVVQAGGLLYYLGLGVKYVIYPPLIFLGIGAMTDFGPMIANPKTIILGAAAQIGIFVTFIVAYLLGNTGAQAASIGIIGGADGPTAIYLAEKLNRDMVSSIAIAAYSYMALIPIIQPPVMRLLTTKKERQIKMEQLRTVSKAEKIIYPVMVTAVVGIILPMSIPLLGMLMLGNLLRESGVVERLSKTASNELINIITIFLGVVVGSKAAGPTFLSMETLKIIFLGLMAFIVATASGVLIAKFMNLFLKKKINPLIGSAGVSAVPMAARVSQLEGQKADPTNYLLMHAMGPNVAGVIGSAIAAGALLAMFGV
jgi:oxaloacetate decarboxylase beta subunit